MTHALLVLGTYIVQGLGVLGLLAAGAWGLHVVTRES